jgi:membrane-associated phospholipid phosphatase
LHDKVERIAESLNDKYVLARLDVFLALYFGWLGFTFLYTFLAKYSRDVTPYLLNLPFTSRSFVVEAMRITRSIPPLYYFMKGVYFVGFSGSIALSVFFILIYWRDLDASDELAARYFLSYLTCGITYTFMHVYAPHYVYGLNVVAPSSTYLTQREFVLPSLHNTIAAVNVITLWKHRDKLWGKILIGLNSLIPFSTILLGHHWIYDALAGIFLAILIGEATKNHRMIFQSVVHKLDVSHIKTATALGLAAGGYLLFLALTTLKP